MPFNPKSLENLGKPTTKAKRKNFALSQNAISYLDRFNNQTAELERLIEMANTNYLVEMTNWDCESEMVSQMGKHALERLKTAIAVQEIKLRVQWLREAGFTAIAEKDGGYWSHIMVAVDELEGVWASAEDCDRLLASVCNTKNPAKSFAKWAPTVPPLSSVQYSQQELEQMARADHRLADRRLRDGEISVEERHNRVEISRSLTDG